MKHLISSAILISPYVDPDHIAPARSAAPHGQLVPASGITNESTMEVSGHSVTQVAPDLLPIGISLPGPHGLSLIVVRQNAGASPEEDRRGICCPHSIVSCPDLQPGYHHKSHRSVGRGHSTSRGHHSAACHLLLAKSLPFRIAQGLGIGT